MNILIAGLAKSGTTMLFSRIQRALGSQAAVFFEPERPEELRAILQRGKQGDTLSKVLVGRVLPDNEVVPLFDKRVLIFRDPRDQFVSMLLYLFYDFQLNGDQAGYDACVSALEQKQLNPSSVSAIGLYNQLAEAVGRAPVAVFNNLHKVQRAYIDAFSPYQAKYEDLLDGHWDRLGSYLNLDLRDDAEVPAQYNRVVRSKGYGDWRDWINEEDSAYIAANWSTSIQALGYCLDEPNSQQVISAATTLDYVAQFNPRAR